MAGEPFTLKIDYVDRQGVMGVLEVVEREGVLYVNAVDIYPDGRKSELEYRTERYDVGRILAKYNQVRRITKDRRKHVVAVLMAVLTGE